MNKNILLPLCAIDPTLDDSCNKTAGPIVPIFEWN